MARRRNEAFLATKTHDRTRDGSLGLLETSLKLLQTDHVDLWQLHAMSTMDDVEKVFAKGGALEAFQQAREQKLVRFLGLSGHTDPAVLAEAIRRFPFDADPPRDQRRRPAPPPVRSGAPAARGREGDGDHRDEDPGPRPAPRGLRRRRRPRSSAGGSRRRAPGRSR